VGILRRYFDSPLGYLEDPQWEPIGEQTARKDLAIFVDVERALQDIGAGCVITTDAAEYKRSRGMGQEEP